MQIRDRNILILGGTGLVGMAVAREFLPHEPAALVISGLGREEAEAAVAELATDPRRREMTVLEAEWGDIFLPDSMKERRRAEVLGDAALRGRLVDDVYGELSDDVLTRSALGRLLQRR